MIIKSKRVRARGQALKRVLRHVTDGDDNDAVKLICGNVRDLEDARSDALRFGREYAVRHWILSPEHNISDEQLADLSDRLAVEFSFDPNSAVIWKHWKDRATPTASNEHYHLMCAEVDPVTGGVLSNSHDYRRHEKISRAFEMAWGHSIVPGRHTAAIVAALDQEGKQQIAAALRGVAPPDHAGSFGERDHQRLKRAGYDLPRLRELIAAALSAATDRVDFDRRLAAVGLRVRSGDKKDVLIVEANDGTTVGSLARLTRLRNAALKERMAFNATQQPTTPAQADDPRSNICALEEGKPADGAGVAPSVGDQRTRRAAPNGHHGPTATADSPGHRAVARAHGKHTGKPGSDYDEQNVAGRSWLSLAAGCVLHREALLDLLGVARRMALPPAERIISDLDDIIEKTTRINSRPTALAEPASLLAARRQLAGIVSWLRDLEVERDELTRQLAERPPMPGWRRAFGVTSDPERDTLHARLGRVQEKASQAHATRSAVRHALDAEERKFKAANALHESDFAHRRTEAERRAASARVARALVAKQPRLVWWNVSRVLRVAAEIKAHGHDGVDADASEWDLATTIDIWGVAHRPHPKTF